VVVNDLKLSVWKFKATSTMTFSGNALTSPTTVLSLSKLKFVGE